MEATIKERPMLFSTPMVQAILEGRKTMTRRIVKGIPKHDHYGKDIMDWELSAYPYFKDGEWYYSVQTDVDDSETFHLKCPYGPVGDVIWVRETWGILQPTHASPFNGLPYDGSFHYKADYNSELPKWDEGPSEFSGWKPSIHMPRKLCRLRLKITDIKIERLQDISFPDIQAEGYDFRSMQMDIGSIPWFKRLWQSINGEESWNANPWLWCISFSKL